MIRFIKENNGEMVTFLCLSDDSDINDAFRVFINFLRSIEYGDSTIHNGLVQAQQDVEDVLKCSYDTWEDILVEKEIMGEC